MTEARRKREFALGYVKCRDRIAQWLVGNSSVLAISYVIWRDRNRHGSFVDPSISRDARGKAELQSLRARERDPFGNDISGI